MYGNSILDINYGKSLTPGNDTDNYDIMNQPGVLNMRSTQLSPVKEAVYICHQCSPLDKEFMDLHEMKYMPKKGLPSVEMQVIKRQTEKWFKNFQVF
jgi:hypothetical protein